MSDYLAKLVNCTLRGIEFTDGMKDGKPYRYRNLIRLSVDGKAVELHQNTDLPPNRFDLKGHIVETTTLYVRDVAEVDKQETMALVKNLCELLSFVCESKVCAYHHEFPAGSGQFLQLSVVGTVQSWRPPFDDPADVKRLIETCYARYVALRDPRKLNVVIDYIHHSVMGGLAEEVKIGLVCIAFENLRNNWARDNGYPHIDGFFREKTATTQNPGQSVGIKRHLTEMFNELGMADAEDKSKRVVDTRNEVLHTGLYGNLQNDEIHDFLETTLREYFLRLIGYTGQFYPYRGGSQKPHQI